jgi:Secretion system C-terminal sorting domain
MVQVLLFNFDKMENLRVILIFCLVFAIGSAQVPVQQPYPVTPPTSNIIAAEYYVGDADPGFGNGTPVTIPTGLQDATATNTTLTIPASLASGIQNIHFRSVDQTGINDRWSITNDKTFVNGTFTYPSNPLTSNIIVAEYYVGDVDPGFGNGTSITIPTGLQDATATNTTLTLPASLANGIQNIHFRSVDEVGFSSRWCITNHKAFVNGIYSYPTAIPTSNITALEYYVGDVDPGFGNGTPITIPTGLQDTTATNTTLTLPASLASGIQNIHFRSVDEVGFSNRWSITNHKAFVNGTYSYPSVIPTTNIIALEYYVGNVDPGFGNGTPITIPTGLQDDIITNTTLTIPSIANGIQNIYFRTIDQTGFSDRWSMSNNKEFIVGTLSIPDFDIANLKVFPNPFYDELSIKYDKELTKISVVNFLGQEILTRTNNGMETKLDLSGISSGTYFLQLTANNVLKTAKVVKK